MEALPWVLLSIGHCSAQPLSNAIMADYSFRPTFPSLPRIMHAIPPQNTDLQILILLLLAKLITNLMTKDENVVTVLLFPSVCSESWRPYSQNLKRIRFTSKMDTRNFRQRKMSIKSTTKQSGIIKLKYTS